jgi:flagellar hook assembly protein FlgD
VATGAGTQSGSYEQRTATRVEVSIYDVMGRRVKSLYNRDELRDVLTLSWDGTDERAVPAPSGVYFVRAKAGSDMAVEKILLIR